MEDRRTRARTLVAVALDAVEAELSTPAHGLPPDDLGAVRQGLRGYLAALDGGDLPPRRDRGEGLGKLVADSWPYDLHLSTLVIQAERAWRNA
jgi:hypothetical protein